MVSNKENNVYFSIRKRCGKKSSSNNEQYHEAFNLAKEAIMLDENCADAYQCAANVCMSLSRDEDGNRQLFTAYKKLGLHLVKMDLAPTAFPSPTVFLTRSLPHFSISSRSSPNIKISATLAFIFCLG